MTDIPSLVWPHGIALPAAGVRELLDIDDPVADSWLAAAGTTRAAASERTNEQPEVLSARFIGQLEELGLLAASALGAAHAFRAGTQQRGQLTDTAKAAPDQIASRLCGRLDVLADAVIGKGERAEIGASVQARRSMERRIALQTLGACAAIGRTEHFVSVVSNRSPDGSEGRISAKVTGPIPPPVDHACELLGLPGAAAPLVTAALTHASWAHDRQGTHGKVAPSQGALSTLGAWAVRFWAVRQRLYEFVGGSPLVARDQMDLSNAALADLGRRTGFLPLLGGSFRSKPVSAKVLADCTQALVGVVVVHAGVDAQLESAGVLSEWLRERSRPPGVPGSDAGPQAAIDHGSRAATERITSDHIVKPLLPGAAQRHTGRSGKALSVPRTTKPRPQRPGPSLGDERRTCRRCRRTQPRTRFPLFDDLCNDCRSRTRTPWIRIVQGGSPGLGKRA